jgi:hypothetical protein
MTEIKQTKAHTPARTYPDLLTADEKREILSEAENLWRDLQRNDLGGFSGGNRPFYILHAFKVVIEKYGRRDVGLTWSKNDLDDLSPTSEKKGLEAFDAKDAEIADLRRERDLLRQAVRRYGDKSRMGFVEPSELQQAIDVALNGGSDAP